MTTQLKITGVRIIDGVEVLDLTYPKKNTKSFRIIECLEAEAATLDEIQDYAHLPYNKARCLVTWLKGRGLIRHRGELHYELVDPLGASIILAE